MFTVFWFLVAVTFFVLWVVKISDKSSKNVVDKQSQSYLRGYFDGYADHKDNKTYALVTSQTDESLEPTEFIPDTVEVMPVETQTTYFAMSPEAAEEQKTKHNLQNINLTLYIASFLLVAAAALFVGASLPETVRFAGVWIVVLAFYGIGMYLHENVQKLRPASTAFIGTGLAILPFTGIMMYNFILPNASICWFITSVIGLLAFVFTASRLKSQVVAYFAIAFAISAAVSSVATLGIGLIWYYVVLIGFGSIMTFVAKINPKWLPSYFTSPIQQSNRWIVPLTLLASIFSFSFLTITDYWIICLVIAVYYIAVAVSSVKDYDVSVFIARLLLSFAVILVVYDATSSFPATGLAISAIGILQLAFSSLFISNKKILNNNEIFLWIGLAFQLVAPLFVLVSASWASIITGQLLVLLISSFSFAYILKRAPLSAFGTFAAAILPIIWGESVLLPSLEPQYLSLIFITFAIVAIAVRSLAKQIKKMPIAHILLNINFGIFLFEALVCTFGISTGWQLVIWSIAVGLLYCLSYLEHEPAILIVANPLLVVTGYWLVKILDINVDWHAVALSWIVYIFLFGSHLLLTAASKLKYSVIFWWSAIVAATLISLLGLFSGINSAVIFAGLGLALVGAQLAMKGWNSGRYGYTIPGAIIITIGLQRIFGIVVPDANFLVYTHWWAAVMAALSYIYYKVGKYDSSKAMAIIAISLVSFFTGIIALNPFSTSVVDYRLIFLIEHVILLVYGLATSRKLYSVWGAVCVILAILWMLSGYTYLLLAVVAFTLIGIAIYALTRQSKKAE